MVQAGTGEKKESSSGRRPHDDTAASKDSATRLKSVAAVPTPSVWLEGDQEASDLDGDSLPNDNCRSEGVSPLPPPPASDVYAVVNKKKTVASGVSVDTGNAAVKPRLAPKPNRWKMASQLRTSASGASDNIPLIKISQTESVERADKENEELLTKRFKTIEPLKNQQADFDDLQVSCYSSIPYASLGWKLSSVVFYHSLTLRNTTRLSFQPNKQRITNLTDLMYLLRANGNQIGISRFEIIDPIDESSFKLSSQLWWILWLHIDLVTQSHKTTDSLLDSTLLIIFSSYSKRGTLMIFNKWTLDPLPNN